MTNQHEVDQLAKAFRAVIRTWVSPADLSAIDATNRASREPIMCDTHTYCDANAAMNEAWTQVFTGTELDLSDEQHVETLNRAWDQAKARGFGDDVIGELRAANHVFRTVDEDDRFVTFCVSPDGEREGETTWSKSSDAFADLYQRAQSWLRK